MKRPLDHIIPSFLQMMLLFTVVLSGCNVARFVPENEKLYTGASVKIRHDHQMKKAARVRSELESALRPRPNATLLGGRPGLWSYYKGSRETSGFITRFLNKRFGEKPVYLSEVNLSRSEDFLRNSLENRGYYYNSVESRVNEGKHRADITYTVKSGAPYVLADY